MSDIGEKGFLHHLLPSLSVDSRFVNGFGQDASAIDLGLPDGLVAIMKIDRAAQPMAYREGWATVGVWGRLAVAANCSDVLACGGQPIAFMVALILPRDFDADEAEEIVHGCAGECSRVGVAFVGGDTKEGGHPELVGTALGIADRKDLLSRNGGADGDVVLIAGEIGGFLGAYLLARDAREESDLPGQTKWIDYLSYPEVQWGAAAIIREARGVRSGTDTSDGIYSGLLHLGDHLGVELEEDLLPLHSFAIEAEDRLGVSAVSLGLGVGDWNILYSVAPRAVDEILLKAEETGVALRRIGTITSRRSGVWLRRSASIIEPLNPEVNEHFIRRQEDGGDYIERIIRQATADE